MILPAPRALIVGAGPTGLLLALGRHTATGPACLVLCPLAGRWRCTLAPWGCPTASAWLLQVVARGEVVRSIGLRRAGHLAAMAPLGRIGIG